MRALVQWPDRPWLSGDEEVLDRPVLWRYIAESARNIDLLPGDQGQAEQHPEGVQSDVGPHAHVDEQQANSGAGLGRGTRIRVRFPSRVSRSTRVQREARSSRPERAVRSVIGMTPVGLPDQQR